MINLNHIQICYGSAKIYMRKILPSILSILTMQEILIGASNVVELRNTPV